MANKRSVRTIKVDQSAKSMLAEIFHCTERMVYQALCGESNSDLAKKIRYVAMKQFDGWIEAAVPEEEIFYDTKSDGERVMRQYFGNGAMLEISLESGFAKIMFKGEQKAAYGKVTLDFIPKMQEEAKRMR